MSSGLGFRTASCVARIRIRHVTLTWRTPRVYCLWSTRVLAVRGIAPRHATIELVREVAVVRHPRYRVGERTRVGTGTVPVPCVYRYRYRYQYPYRARRDRQSRRRLYWRTGMACYATGVNPDRSGLDTGIAGGCMTGGPGFGLTQFRGRRGGGYPRRSAARSRSSRRRVPAEVCGGRRRQY